MVIEPAEIKQAVKTERNASLSFHYAASGCVESFTIKELAANNGYLIHGMVVRNDYENECRIHLDGKLRVQTYDCDCPFCNDYQACAHIGSILVKINQLQPEEFPYTYEKDDLATEVDYEQQFMEFQSQLQQHQIERQKRFEEERRRQMEEEKKEVQRLHLAYTKQMIHQEQEALYHSMIVDHSGRIQLHLVYEGVSVSHYEYGVHFGLRIGNKKQYVIRNIFGFIRDVEEKNQVRYGKELSFVHDHKAFDEDSQRILAFLIEFEATQLCYPTTAFRRSPLVDRDHLKEFYELCDQLPREYCEFTCEKRMGMLQIRMQEFDDYVQLELCNFAKLQMGAKDTHGIYQVEDKQLVYYHFDEQGQVMRLLESFESFHGELLIDRSDLKEFSKYIWQGVTDFVEVQGNVTIFKAEELDTLCLYGDMDDMGQMSIRLEGMLDGKRIYGFDPECINKPLSLELVETYIKNFAMVIDPQEHVAYLPHDDDSTYSFVKDGLPFLQDYCEVYVSDALMRFGSVHHVDLQAGVRLNGNLLEVNFQSFEINKEELFDVLRSYRRKKKYHRLKNGHLLSLDAQEFEAFDQMVEVLQIKEKDLVNGQVHLPSYRSFLFEEKMGIPIHHDSNMQALLQNFQKKELHEFAIPKHYEGILRDYQVSGYQWLKLMNHYQFGAILADDMGLGKTLQVIALLDSEQGHGPSLIIAPSSLLLNWVDEIHKFAPHLDVLAIIGNATKRKTWIQAIKDQIIITSYDYIKRDVEHYEQINFHYIVLDEAQYIKNQKSLNARSVKELKSTHKLALSGTPIENSLAELWSLFDFLMKGYLYNYHYFVQEFEKPIVQHHEKGAQEKLKHMVEPFLLRRNKKDVLTELPDKVEHTLMISFREEEQKLYLANLMQVSKELQAQLHTGKMDQIQVLSMLTRLRQLCCEPRALYENIQEPSSKLQACLELCLSLKENGQKVLVFSSFTSVLDLLEEELYKYHFRYLKLTGANTKEERRLLVKQFQDGDADVFLISLKAGGTGLNLTKAEAVIHFDPWWNRSAQNQATDRAYRMGQEKNVQVFQLIMKDSIEEKIQKLQEEKMNLADTFIEHSDGSITSMNESELLALFSIQ